MNVIFFKIFLKFRYNITYNSASHKLLQTFLILRQKFMDKSSNNYIHRFF